jgi:hypothetical protein
MIGRLNSLWVGDRLGYIERLCLISALSVGHPFTLYSYTPKTVRGVPDGVDLRDAREIMSEDKFVRQSGAGAIAIRSDFFRYALLAQDRGYWVDMDFYFLKPLEFEVPYVFGWERDGSINNAVLRIPPRSDMVRDLCDLPNTNWRPPFFGPRRSALYYWARLTKGDVRVEDLPWGVTGPELVTYVARKHGVAQLAQKKSIFYPVPYEDAKVLFDAASIVEGMIKPETHAVHMWHSRLGDLVKKPPVRNSFLDVICRRFEISTS